MFRSKAALQPGLRKTTETWCVFQCTKGCSVLRRVTDTALRCRQFTHVPGGEVRLMTREQPAFDAWIVKAAVSRR